MSAAFPNSFYNTNPTPVNVVNVTMQGEKPCPPVMISYIYGSTIGWNAVLVGLLSSLLAIAFLLTCLYYLVFRRRCGKRFSDELSVETADKAAAANIPVTSTSQSVSTTVLNEPGKETKISTYSEQISGPVANGDFAITMTENSSNGHVSNGSPGLLTNGSTDPSELHLLQHEHH